MPAGVSWTSPPLCSFEQSRLWMEARFGEPHWRDLDSNGIGLFDAWALRFACGHEVTLWLFHQRDPWTDCFPHELAPVEIYANDPEHGHTCFHVGIDRDSLSLWEPDAGHDGPLVWAVRRQDDNGNQYELGRFSSRCEAEAVARVGEVELDSLHGGHYTREGSAGF